MNKEQYFRIRRIIESDCVLRRRYVNKKGQTCAIGALIKDVGLELPKPGTTENIESVQTLFDSRFINTRAGLIRNPYRVLYQPVKKVFGLSLTDLEEIQLLNDVNPFRKKRISDIMNYIHNKLLGVRIPIEWQKEYEEQEKTV